MITDFKLFESKNIQNLYHILDTEKLHFVLTNNEIKSYKFHYISTTRNKMMNGYTGDNSKYLYRCFNRYYLPFNLSPKLKRT